MPIDIGTMGIKALKALIMQAGLSSDDWYVLSAQRLGKAYYTGQGCMPVDLELFYRYYTTAGEQGDAFSQ